MNVSKDVHALAFGSDAVIYPRSNDVHSLFQLVRRYGTKYVLRKGVYDDQVDVLSQTINWFAET